MSGDQCRLAEKKQKEADTLISVRITVARARHAGGPAEGMGSTRRGFGSPGRGDDIRMSSHVHNTGLLHKWPIPVGSHINCGEGNAGNHSKQCAATRE